MKTNEQTDTCVELNQLRFDNAFVRELPADPESINRVRQVPGACFSRVEPTAVSQPQTIACALEVAEKLNLSEPACENDQFAQVFSGNELLPNMAPFAMCYGGHQFGNWAGQLGDGRAINLGEVLNQQGERWILQLKGAGRTPYSRQGDGLAVLRSSVREFLCSEAMYHLGVPTTRALSLVSTGDKVPRDMFYDGHPKLEPGAWSAGWHHRFCVSAVFRSMPGVKSMTSSSSWSTTAFASTFPTSVPPRKRFTGSGFTRSVALPRS